MQTTLPTHSIQSPRTQYGPISGAIVAAGSAGVGGIVSIACAYLGNMILQATGREGLDMPAYADLLVPTLVGTTVIAGSLGLLAGCTNPDANTI